MYTLSVDNGCPVTAVNFSSDGEYILSGGLDSDVMLWKSNLDFELDPMNKCKNIIKVSNEFWF
jgi:WD40 repeat protein